MKFRVILTITSIALTTMLSAAQEVKVVKFDMIKELLQNDSEKVRVVNFWATWWAPCVKELPNFEVVNQKYSNVEVILVNLDFVEGLDKVKRFVAKKELKKNTAIFIIINVFL